MSVNLGHLAMKDDNVLIRRVDGQTTRGGIILPDSSKKTLEQGLVVAMGPGGMHDGKVVPITGLAIGDSVFFKRWAASDIDLGDDSSEYVVVKAVEIVCVFGGKK